MRPRITALLATGFAFGLAACAAATPAPKTPADPPAEVRQSDSDPAPNARDAEEAGPRQSEAPPPRTMPRTGPLGPRAPMAPEPPPAPEKDATSQIPKGWTVYTADTHLIFTHRPDGQKVPDAMITLEAVDSGGKSAMQFAIAALVDARKTYQAGCGELFAFESEDTVTFEYFDPASPEADPAGGRYMSRSQKDLDVIMIGRGMWKRSVAKAYSDDLLAIMRLVRLTHFHDRYPKGQDDTSFISTGDGRLQFNILKEPRPSASVR